MPMPRALPDEEFEAEVRRMDEEVAQSDMRRTARLEMKAVHSKLEDPVPLCPDKWEWQRIHSRLQESAKRRGIDPPSSDLIPQNLDDLLSREKSEAWSMYCEAADSLGNTLPEPDSRWHFGEQRDVGYR